MNKTAKEMFEELGYKKIDSLPIFIDYTKQGRMDDIKIIFNLEKKEIIKQDYELGYSYYVTTFDEIQAIKKQIEELHWNDIGVE